ncbi:hypothetical protein MKEN_00168200 [Mycena kentingensis (nom. inval.)]|nr:hypothetical protein MKEN_00168200 [Mycena kentingensis (nom. inval.)]
MSTPAVLSDDALLLLYCDTWYDVAARLVHPTGFREPPNAPWFVVVAPPGVGVYGSFEDALRASGPSATITYATTYDAAISDVARHLFKALHPGRIPERLQAILANRAQRPPHAYPPPAAIVGQPSPPSSPPSSPPPTPTTLPGPQPSKGKPIFGPCLWVVTGKHEVRFLTNKDLALHAFHELEAAGDTPELQYGAHIEEGREVVSQAVDDLARQAKVREGHFGLGNGWRRGNGWGSD